MIFDRSAFLLFTSIEQTKTSNVFSFFSRQKPMGLIVALSQGPGYEAKGNLFWDDGESFGKHFIIYPEIGLSIVGFK